MTSEEKDTSRKEPIWPAYAVSLTAVGIMNLYQFFCPEVQKGRETVEGGVKSSLYQAGGKVEECLTPDCCRNPASKK